ncbi:RNA polymerase sigma factor [Microbacteriaceae bacterium VKM Ac-2854]|nr:RNA polymerase sigma factor [Microbacteriaceae bacterium VKM Ac-2854]
MTDASDVELVVALARGAQPAFNELYDRHALTVYRWVRARENDAGAVEDLVQSVFLLLWKKRASVVVRGSSLLPWLLVTARYEVLASYRKRGIAITRSVNDSDGTSQSTVEDLVASRIQLEQVADVVRSLPELDQSVFRLCMVEGLRYEEAARALGVAPGAVRNRLSRVRRGLIQQLGPLRSMD